MCVVLCICVRACVLTGIIMTTMHTTVVRLGPWRRRGLWLLWPALPDVSSSSLRSDGVVATTVAITIIHGTFHLGYNVSFCVWAIKRLLNAVN